MLLLFTHTNYFGGSYPPGDALLSKAACIARLPWRGLQSALWLEYEIGMSQQTFRGAPSTVKNFMTSSGCSMEGTPPRKETVPTILGVAQC